jgi:hypothetical protein
MLLSLPNELIELILQDFFNEEKLSVMLASKLVPIRTLKIKKDELVETVVRSNNLKYYQWLESILVVENVMNACAKWGSLEILKYAHENGCRWDGHTCEQAAGGGYLECLKYLHENNCPWNERTCNSAVKGRHLSCLKYAHENGCPWSVDTYVKAVLYGGDAYVKYLVDNNCLE